MNIEVIEISLSGLVSAPSVIDTIGTNDEFVYEHLKRYCSKFRPLPAITVTLDRGRLVVVDRYIYVQIARELGDDRIRAVLKEGTLEELQKQGVPGLLALVPKAILEYELRKELVPGWHVLFFESVPEQNVIKEIDVRFRNFLKQSLSNIVKREIDLESVISSSFDVTGPCFEIQFPTPIAERSWAISYRKFLESISNELCTIETYQGRRFKT